MHSVLDPRRLRLLVLLSSLGTVRAVASAASLSASAVSQQLAVLEREAGVALLVRHGRSVALTDAGVALAAHAREILGAIDAAEEALRAAGSEPAGTVRVAAFTSAMRAFVIDAAAALGRAHPELHVQLAELEPARCLEALERGEADLGVVGDFGDGTLPHTPHLARVPLVRDELQVVAPSALAGPLREADWLVDGTDLETFVVRHCRAAGFEPRIAGRLFSHEALLAAVAAGLGVTVLPGFALLSLPPGVAVRPLVPAASRTLLVAHRVGAIDRRSVALVLDALVARASAPRAGTRSGSSTPSSASAP